MRKQFLALLTGALVLVLSVGVGVSIAAAPGQDVDPANGGKHDLDHPLGAKQRELRATALAMKLKGKIPAGAKVGQVAKGQYVELAREGEDSIWTVLGEFGTQIHPATGGTPGPLHNEIPEPNRSVDNTTIWTDDFSTPYYEGLLFSEAPGAISMRNFYIEQSSNRYTVNGEVDGWVSVPFNEARYGTNICGGIVCSTVWDFVNHSVDAWAASMSTADANAYLSQFDVWDRYDYDGDGDFTEADGYIDHFQSVHAGEGEETGGGAQGANAIWSHRWYAFFNLIGTAGPGFNKAGGVQIGNTDYWIGDYTIEPENGGVGVFAHEFAHDLGLPDLYETSGNTGGAENSTGFWTLMSSGSYGNDGTEDIGSKPTHMGAWEKFQLGWLNYEVGVAGAKSEHKIGPAESNTKQAQGVFVVLPDKVVPLNLGAPCSGCGSRYFYSGSGDNLDNSMAKSIPALAAATPLTAQVRYDIEASWDYAYLQASSNGGTSWTNILTSLSENIAGDPDGPNDQNLGFGITGDTGGAWVALTGTLPAGTNAVRLRYVTDGAVVEPGFQADQITVGGTVIGTAETESEGWTFTGFRTTTGSETQSFFNAYVAENRQYIGYDESLRTGPYNFGFLNTKPDWVEHFPYQDGLLVSYWDTSFTDNNVADNPGGGLILPVDAHPTLVYRPDGAPWRPRVQSYDSTFGLEPTDRVTLHVNGVASTFGGLPAVPVFDDTKDFYVEPGEQPGANGWSGVRVPNTGTQIRVQSATPGGFMQVEVRSAK